LDPHTASDMDKKYVSLTLDAAFFAEYPERAPIVDIKGPRGLREGCVAQLLCSLKAKAEEYAEDACPVTFELVELAREFLTAKNERGPADECSICLMAIAGGEGGDKFVRTPCDHYFHALCLGRHVDVTIRYKSKRINPPVFFGLIPLIFCRLHQQGLKENPIVPGSTEDRSLKITCPVCRTELKDVKVRSKST